jgi:choline dehydrogenase-like flavoprotein
MLKDLREGSPEETYDVCVIGAGPAGLTLVAELAPTGRKICVVECGLEKKSPPADALREVESRGEIRIKEESRERVLGGASSTWAGLSAPLDGIDFAPRPYLSFPSSWPFPRAELEPHYRRIECYGFAPFDAFGEGGLSEARHVDELSFAGGPICEKIFIAADPPWNFGKKLRGVLDLPNIDLALGAAVTGFASSATGVSGLADVTAAKVKTISGREVSVRAKIFVIAAGGLESVRLLLASRDTCPAGLGNERDQVGRYLMNHPKDCFGVLALSRPVTRLPYLFGHLKKGWAGYAGLRFGEEEQRRRGVLNSYLRFEPVFDWTDSRGVQALVWCAKSARLMLSWWKRRQQDRLVELREWSETGDDVNPALAGAAGLSWFRAAYEIVRDLPAVFAYAYHRLRPNVSPLVREVRLRNFMEMEPRPENRLTLSDRLDRNGVPVPVVQVSTSALDRRSLVELHRAFGEEAARLGFGTLRGDLAAADPWPIAFDASHHLGGARAGIDPADSVVDANLRVHTAANLYVASGAVFPTSGCANPTYTICALAARLAEHLRSR